MSEIRETIGVCGAGTMGAGIAYAGASAGFDVVLYDITDEAIERGGGTLEKFAASGVERGKLTREAADEILTRITRTTELNDFAKVSFVIEAIVERLDVKRDLFGRLEGIVGESAVLATNTSSLSVTEIAAGLRHPERAVGMHFFNPAHIMRLVEVIRGYVTSEDVVNRTVKLTKDLGKVPVTAKDTPGFIVNRVARNFYGESFRIVGEAAATHDQIDRCLKSVGFKMGPFELMDLIGIDVNFAVTESVYGQYFYEPRFRPHLIQKKMVESGRLGKKSGKGFY